MSEDNWLGLPENTRWFILIARGNFDSLASLYGAHLYLVGSSLTSETPGDYDIRIPLSEEDQARLFGKDTTIPEGATASNFHWRKWREELKQSRRLSRRLRFQYRVDIQFTSPEAFAANPKPKLQLDQATEDFLLAGFGEPT